MNLESFKFQFSGVLKELPKIALLGIRGYQLEGVDRNRIGIYDDCIVRYINDEIKCFPASVDPGDFYINHPINPKGCAELQTGLWWYQLGEHHSKQALVQADEVSVDRLDRRGKRLCDEHGWYSINIHSGGPEYIVGRYSAGCQVIQTTEPWKAEWLDFFIPIVAGTVLFQQKKIPYLLVDKLKALPERPVSS